MNVKLIRKGTRTNFHTGAGAIVASLEGDCAVIILPSNDRRIKYLKGRPWNFTEVVIKEQPKSVAKTPIKDPIKPIKDPIKKTTKEPIAEVKAAESKNKNSSKNKKSIAKAATRKKTTRNR